MGKMTQYKFKRRKGIDDLKSLFAFHGNSQGDETRTNDIQQYLDSEGWLSFDFDCELSSKAILDEIKKRKKWNNSYIEELIEKGEYGKEQEHVLSVDYNPLFDNNNNTTLDYPLESYKFLILDYETN